MAGTLVSSGSYSALKGGGASAQCFRVTYHSLEGYTNLLGRKTEKHAAIADYHLRSCIFHTTCKQFIGRFHDSMPCGLVESLQSGAVVCPIEQNAFFYSPQVDPSLILVTELTATFMSGSEERCVCLGWALLSVFDRTTTTAGISSSTRHTSSVVRGGGVRLALYEGSPRALYSMGHPGSDSKDMVPIPGCILTCSLQPHPTLTKASHLFPGNMLVSYNDIIPGLVPIRVPEAFPKLVRTTSASLEKVSLLLLPSVDDFEENLIAMLSNDLLDNESSVGSGNSSITIEERRLKVLLYNGWHFTSPPSIGYLEKVSPSARASLRSSGYGFRSNLVLKGSMELTDVISHPLMEVVLQLEYVVSWSGVAIVPVDTPTRSTRRGSTVKPSSTHSTTLTLGWAAWQPCTSDTPLEEECHASIELKSGPGFKPTIIPNSACKACYQGNLSDAGKVTFKFIPNPRSSLHVESSQLFEDLTPSKPLPQHGEDMPDNAEEPTGGGVTGEPKPSPAHGPISSTPRKKGTPPPPSSNEELVAMEISHPAVDIKLTAHPVVAATPARTPYAVSRSTLAYLHSAGFEEFRDNKGNPLPTIDPHTTPLKDHSSAGMESGPYQIAVQLLAFASSQSMEVVRVPTSLLLSLQFFSFPSTASRALLVRSEEEEKEGGSSLPLILRPSDFENQVGITHCYGINHVTLPTKADREDLTRLLLSAHLSVDVYDGDSLILLGTATLPLRGLLSREKDYFQFTLASPVRLARETADPTLTTVTMVSRDAHIAGKLYVMLAKLPVDNRDIPQPEQLRKQPSHSRLARRLYGYDRQKENSETKEDEQTRKRKHARMQCVREMRQRRKVADVDTTAPEQLQINPPSLNQPNMVNIQREELRHEAISSVLEEALTSSCLLYPRMGRMVYFEHKLRNTHNHPLSVTISWKDPDLRLVTDRSECHYLRQLHSIHTAIDDNLITENPDGGGQFGFLVHPGETVSIPFKYQTFQPPPSLLPGTEMSFREEGGNRTVKVYFQVSRRDLLSILNLQFRPRLQRVDRTFHFYHPEKTFLKRQFELQQNILAQGLESGTLESTLTASKLFVCTSEPDIICEIKQANDSRMVVIKAPVKPAPAVHSFFVMVYSKKYIVSPTEIWQVFIHSVHRVDHSLVMGQASTLRLTLHGNHTNRRVACYSFSAPVMKVVTPSPFLLAAHSLTEVEISIKTYSTGNHHVIVTAVDVDSRQLVDAWLVCSTSQEPGVSRAFQITLPVGGNAPTQKTITFTNPYPKTKKFSLSNNHPHLVSFTTTTLKLHSQETTVLGLQFSPSSQQLSANVLVFINDELDQTEECFLVKTVYTHS